MVQRKGLANGLADFEGENLEDFGGLVGREDQELEEQVLFRVLLNTAEKIECVGNPDFDEAFTVDVEELDDELEVPAILVEEVFQLIDQQNQMKALSDSVDVLFEVEVENLQVLPPQLRLDSSGFVNLFHHTEQKQLTVFEAHCIEAETEDLLLGRSLRLILGNQKANSLLLNPVFEVEDKKRLSEPGLTENDECGVILGIALLEEIGGNEVVDSLLFLFPEETFLGKGTGFQGLDDSLESFIGLVRFDWRVRKGVGGELTLRILQLAFF